MFHFYPFSGKRPVDIALAHGNDERKQFVRKLQFYMSGLIKFEPNDNNKDLKHVKVSYNWITFKHLI